MRKVSPFLISPLLCTLSERYLLRFLLFSFRIIWKDLRELLLVLVIFALKQKTSKTKKKKHNKNKNGTTLRQKVCYQTIHQIALKSLWIQPVGKTCSLCRRNGAIVHAFRKSKEYLNESLMDLPLFMRDGFRCFRLKKRDPLYSQKSSYNILNIRISYFS